MIWILAIIVVVAIYNAERMPQIVNKIKSDVPHIVEAGKKASKDLKEKVIEEYLNGNSTFEFLANKYNISTRQIVRSWV